MSATTSYEQLALSWQPDSKEQKQWIIILLSALMTAFLLSTALNFISVPNDERRQVKVPERVAKFIRQKPKVVKPKPVAKVKPSPKPVAKPKPKVSRKKPEQRKPLTATQKKARDKAANSGLLALASEFSDLMDSSAVDAAVSAKVTSVGAGTQSINNANGAELLAASAAGSGGMASARQAVALETGGLSAEQLIAANEQLLAENSKKTQVKAVADTSSPQVREGDHLRSEESISIVFDQNKGRLQSIYNRERRKNPSLQGKIVFEVTVAPDGKVSLVKVLSSELNDEKLERRLASRIKGFNFGSANVEAVTITFPIEFLPS